MLRQLKAVPVALTCHTAMPLPLKPIAIDTFNAISIEQLTALKSLRIETTRTHQALDVEVDDHAVAGRRDGVVEDLVEHHGVELTIESVRILA
jgi:hypothetical protein